MKDLELDVKLLFCQLCIYSDRFCTVLNLSRNGLVSVVDPAVAVWFNCPHK